MSPRYNNHNSDTQTKLLICFSHSQN